MMRHVAANTLTLLAVVLVLVFGLVTWAQSTFRSPGPLEAPLRFEVARGEGLGTVADRLAEAGAISNERLFRIGARYRDLDAGPALRRVRTAGGRVDGADPRPAERRAAT